MDDQLAVLRRLRKEGQISKEDFEYLAGKHNGNGSTPAVDAPANDVPIEFAPVAPPDDDERSTSPEADGAEASVDEQAIMRGIRNVVLVGGLVIAAVIIVSLVSNVGGSPVTAAPAVTTPTVETAPESIPGSLGLYMNQVADTWNEVQSPLNITKGLTRYNESGKYDTFLYRFGEYGRLAGAYDPETEAVYALLVTGDLADPATAQLYLHLCQMTDPYSPDCIDAYNEKGLAGLTLAEYTDLAHQTEWVQSGDTWRLEIEGNLVTIRVFGPDAA